MHHVFVSKSSNEGLLGGLFFGTYERGTKGGRRVLKRRRSYNQIVALAFRKQGVFVVLKIALQAEDPSIETLRTAKERAVEEAKDAWKKLAAAQQKITALTEAMSSIKEVVTQLRATSAELAKQLEPEVQLNYKNTQKNREQTAR